MSTQKKVFKPLISKVTMVLCIGFVMLLAGGMELHAQERLAVFDFRVIDGMSDSEAKTLTNKFRNEMAQTGKYSMVERSAMEQVLSEQRFSASDLADQDKAVELGRLLSASKVVVGDIGKVGRTYSIDVRMINVETGVRVRSTGLEYRGELDGLLEEFEVLARKLAGTYEEKKNRTWLYVAGAGVLGGVAAGLYFLGGGGSGGDSGLPLPPSPPSN